MARLPGEPHEVLRHCDCVAEPLVEPINYGGGYERMQTAARKPRENIFRHFWPPARAGRCVSTYVETNDQLEGEDMAEYQAEYGGRGFLNFEYRFDKGRLGDKDTSLISHKMVLRM